MKRKLISSAEATPAPKQLTKPCSDCPWARDALNGWLGDNTAQEWIQMAHGETHIPCHVHPNVQCAGAAIYRANVAKLVRDPDVLRLPADRETVFARPTEFLGHHAKTPERKLLKAQAGAEVVDAAAQEVLAKLDAVAKPLTKRQYSELLSELATDIELRSEAVRGELKADLMFPKREQSEPECTCYMDCHRDSHSGRWHQHEDDPCPVHPDAVMVG